MANCARALAGLLMLSLVLPAWGNTPDRNDIRVLIDISGSMRQNDPQNLRRPALRMLVNLMQPDTRAGVWTFATWANRLVPPADIDAAWKKKALTLSDQINSPGQFTHIERVLEDAIKDWSGQPTTHNRHLVLLTDGMVDVSKVAGESEASRQRILEVLLPRIKELGARVHAIALSARADHALMKRLSGESDGWYQQVESADALQRVFLKIFEQVGKPDAVPLNDNRFTVDASVREATVLLFRKPGSNPPVLISPSGQQYTDSDLPTGIAWYRDQGYDLITVSSPERGEWSLQSDPDPDNRVMIVTDLKLETSEIPAHIAVGEVVPMTANLTNRGELVDRKAFLRLLDVRADAMNEAGTDPQGLNDAGEEGDEVAGDGRYSMLYREQRPFAQVELLFSVDSATFMREKRYRLAVHEPAGLTLQGEGDAVRASVEIDQAVMRDGAEVAVWQVDASGNRVDLAKSDEDNAYVLQLAELPVYMSVSGQTQLGNLVARDYGPVYPPGVDSPLQAEPPIAQDPLPADDGVQPSDAPAQEPAAAEVEEVVAQEDDWMMPAIIFGGVNLVLVLVGLGVWLVMRRKRRGNDDEVLFEELDDRIELDAEHPILEEVDDTEPAKGKGEAA